MHSNKRKIKTINLEWKTIPATGLCDVSLADRILSFSECDPSITPNKLQDVKS